MRSRPHRYSDNLGSDSVKMKTPIYLFPGGKSKAVTFSYDDGCIQDEKLIGIFNRYGIKATFNLNGAAVDGRDWSESQRIAADQVKELYAGHEVAAHAEFHAGLDRIAATDVIREIFNDRMILEKAVGYPVTGFAYPCGQYSDKSIEILRAAGFEYARTTEYCGPCRYIPDDFMRWKPTCHHRDALQHMDAVLNETRPLMQTLYIYGHSFEFDRDDNWDLIEMICQKLTGLPDAWYCTNIMLCRYVKAIRSLVSGANGHLLYNPTAETVWFFADGWGMSDLRSVAPGETVEF